MQCALCNVYCALVPVVELLNVPPPPIVLWLAGVKLAFHLWIIHGYGWFRDEFYYIACGEHLDWGYVDHPPLVALVTATTRAVLGDSIVAIRLPAALAGPATVIVTGLLAYELGAGRFGQGLAALAVLVATIYLPLQHILSMNAWEPLLWSGVALFVVRGLDRGGLRDWAFAGVLAGVGLQNKHSMLFFGFALLVGLALSPARRTLWTRGPWTMGLVAAVIFLPNVVWEARHGWPTLEFMQHARTFKNVALPPLAFVGQQALVMNPVNAVVWVSGLGWLLFAAAARGWRFLGWAYLALLALFIATGGKDYYLAPYLPDALCGGRRRHRAVDRRHHLATPAANDVAGVDAVGRRRRCAACGADSPRGDLRAICGGLRHPPRTE